MIDSCASRNPVSSSTGTTRRRTESSIGNANVQACHVQACHVPSLVHSKPVPFELSQSNGGCNAQIACYHDGIARHPFRVTAGSQPRRSGGIGQRTFEIFQREPGRGGTSGPDQPAALRDYGIFFVVGEKPVAEEALEHDPEKCEAVFRKDHAQTRS
jgi:hypothetical protein